ncbi:hypothetical protein KAW18_16995 [candidate division WOR-3 bacterium]|nr:hypothetical protein [candidate division WOR-3 bacterium]MCK4529064.1 hypothetical protein [candidate division WOR-3 bacterium]
MKRLLLLMILVITVSAQEVFKKVKIDRKSESNLVTLFEKLPQNIEVFITSDSIYIIEAIYPDQKLIKRLTPAEYRDLLAKKPPKMITLENARVPYLIGQTFHGITLYSWGIPVTFGIEDKSAVLIGLFTPLVYTSTHFLLTRDSHISNGAAYGSFLGGMEGAAHGGLLFKSEKGVFPVSFAENMVDYTLGQMMNFTPAMYQRKFNHCAYSYYHYFALKTLIVGWDEWDDKEDIKQMGTLLSLGEGYSSLFLSKNSENLTFGDALFEFRTGVLGAEVLPLILATYDLHREEQTDERIYAASSLLGHGLGYVLGRKLTRDYDLSGASGIMIWILPYLAHGAAGGLVVLTENEGLIKSYPVIYLSMDIALTYLAYKAFAQKTIGIGKSDVPNFNMAINPMCFILKGKSTSKVPFFMMSYNF